MKKRRYYYDGKRCSKGEKRIIEYLISRNILFKKEYTFVDCVSLTDHKLRFDFYLPEYDILIEADGQHHFAPVNKYSRAKKVHEQTKIHDQIKNNFAYNKNIKLYRISYKEFENINEILDQILILAMNKIREE